MTQEECFAVTGLFSRIAIDEQHPHLLDGTHRERAPVISSQTILGDARDETFESSCVSPAMSESSPPAGRREVAFGIQPMVARFTGIVTTNTVPRG